MKANFHYHYHYWYLVERGFVMEGMNSLFVNVPKGKILLQQEQYQSSFEPWIYF